MKVVIQRVKEASVSIEGEVHSEIGRGLMILAGIQADDTDEDIEWLVQKIISLRIFDDAEGVMNLSVKEIDGDVLIVSQFTLMARVKKGNRPSYIDAAKPEISIPIYERFCQQFSVALGKAVKTGVFGADMKIALINDGPVTIIIDSKNRI
ncbi:D-tyrosyl-tRNA(Tyr) deacylase [Porphyromonadaceae bacterium OttesenSCG-928-L07]|nr:D-tyrosyl-tRNA(Tyr) deacylase [Porphyromonadaceae bacterium OttesenSCG-928-L07]MDL2330791.1 D-tyrosyl-tRNA(Tyr) deacylase [Odoribacter sp. OttesenSCG-928-A06]